MSLMSVPNHLAERNNDEVPQNMQMICAVSDERQKVRPKIEA